MDLLISDPSEARCTVVPPAKLSNTPAASRRRRRNAPGGEMPLDNDRREEQQQPAASDPGDMILTAAMMNNVGDIRYLVEVMRVDPNYTNQANQSALHVASLWGNVEAVGILLRYNANVHARNNISGATPLHSVMMSNKGTVPRLLECLSLLLEHGADPKARDLNGKTPADYYNNSGDGKSRRCLVNKLLPPPPALFRAIEKGDVTGVQQGVLATSGGRWVKINNLQSAAGKKLNGKMGKVLTQEVNQDGRHQVLVSGVKQIKLIKPANLEPCDDDAKEQQQSPALEERYLGQTPLLYTVNLILAERDNPTDYKYLVALMKILRILSRQGRDNNNVDRSTWLIEEGRGNDTDQDKQPSIIVKVCKEVHDLHCESSDNSQESELEIRVMEEICRLLVPFGGSWTTEKEIIRMFHAACRKNNVSLVYFYLEVGQIDPNVHGQGGMTALHFAARSGCTNTVRFLLQTGKVDATVTDKMGKTPMDAARVNQKRDVMTVLEEHIMQNGPVIHAVNE